MWDRVGDMWEVSRKKVCLSAADAGGVAADAGGVVQVHVRFAIARGGCGQCCGRYGHCHADTGGGAADADGALQMRVRIAIACGRCGRCYGRFVCNLR